MYSNVKRVKVILIGGYVLGVCATFALFAVLLHNSKVESIDLRTSPRTGSSLCSIAFSSPSLAAFWLPSLIYDLIFITLSVRIAMKHARYTNQMGGSRAGIWARFVQDSILYFSVTSIMLLGNAIIWMTLPPEWHITPLGFSIVAMCAAGNRLVFKVIQVYYDRSEDDLNSNGAIPLGALPPLRVVEQN